MTPEFRILANSKDITAVIRDRLMSLRVRDEAGLTSDACEIRLDDREPHIEIPRTGADLEVSLGYRESGLTAMGRWTVDEVGMSGPPAEMTIQARAADLLEGLKAPKERSWPDGITLGALVATIAEEHGFIAAVGDDLAGVALAHVDQTESDLNLLTRLAKGYDATSKVAGGRLLFVKKGEAKSAGGKPLASIAVVGNEETTYEVTKAERGKYGAVAAYYHDKASGERVEIKVGSEEPVMTLRRLYADESSARSAARSKLAALERGAATLSLTCPGDVRLMAEARLSLSGIRQGADGEWSVTSVTHVIDGQGYHCEIEAETPKETS